MDSEFHLSIQDAPSFILSRRIIPDSLDDDKNISTFRESSQDTNKFYQMLEEDRQQKEDFLNSDDYNNFQQVLVVCQLRKEYPNDDPFLTHLEIVAKEIKKQVITIFKTPEEQVNSTLRVFYQDINIGFITSSGQIKSTAFMFMNKNQIPSFFQLLQGKYRLAEPSAEPGLVLQLHFLDISIQQFSQEISFNNFKNAFLRNNRFVSQFLVLNKLPQDCKTGTQIFAVYKPVDDQIYAVKKSKLNAQPNQLSFDNVFQNCDQKDPDYFKINEAKILAKLYHPNILKLYEWWIEFGSDNNYYLYMQLDFCSFSGLKYQPNDLLSYAHYYMNRMSNIEKLEKIKDISCQILDGLEYIHHQGIMQRDLKAENIFVTINIHMDLIVRLADFTNSKDTKEDKFNQPSTSEEIRSPTLTNHSKESKIPEFDEFQAFGILLLHLILTFPGEPNQRNYYASTFIKTSRIDEILPLFDSWAVRLVRNRNQEFTFSAFMPVLELAKKLISQTIRETKEIRNQIQLIQLK